MKAKYFCFFLFLSMALFGQKKHTVQPKETVYGISKQYNVAQEDLLKANPAIGQNGLQIGDIITIPGVYENAPTSTSVVNEDSSFYYLEIAPKETLYSISKKYNVSIDDLNKHNPQLSEGLKVGDTIKVPKSGNIPVSTPTTTVTPVTYETNYNGEMIDHVLKNNENVLSLLLKYNVSYEDLLRYNPNLVSTGLTKGSTVMFPAWIKPEMLSKYNDGQVNLLMLLPFHLNDPSKKNVQNVAVDFLNGAKMALDSLAKSGHKVNLKVVDTKNSMQTINQFIADYDMNKVDAVIGPFYGDKLKEFAKQYQEDYLPVFSPVNNDADLNGYKNVFISTPREETVADEIIKELLTRYAGEQIIILTDSKNEHLANYTKQQLELQSENANVLITKNINDVIQPKEVISETLEDGSKFEQEYFTPIVTVLVSNNNTLGKQYVEKVKTMNPENLTVYGIHFVDSYDTTSKKNQKNVLALQNIGFAYSSERLANVFGKNEKELIKKFKADYCANPTKYQQIGYDLTYDVVKRMNNNGFLQDNIGTKQKGFSSNFQYGTVKNGQANVNRSARILKLFKKKPVEPKDVTVAN